MHQMITTLRTNGDKTPELLVEPEGLELQLTEGFGRFQIVASQASGTEASGDNVVSGGDDALVDLFRQQFQVPVENFLHQMREQRHPVESGTR